VLPAGSIARTSKVWVPSVSAGEIVSGLEHDVQLPPSIRHSKVEAGSDALNANEGVVLPEGLGGPESIVVFGAVRSIVQVWLAGVASVLPAASVARTSKVWLPAPSAASVSGLEHDVQLPPSMRHSKLEPGSEELKEKVGVVSLVGSAGVEPIVVAGGVVSIFAIAVTGLETFPTLSAIVKEYR
jgi:hypothetical protein